MDILLWFKDLIEKDPDPNNIIDNISYDPSHRTNKNN